MRHGIFEPSSHLSLVDLAVRIHPDLFFLSISMLLREELKDAS